MTFDELIDIKPNVRVSDIIQLYLLGYDDKIYLNLARYENGYPEFILTDEQIISEKWIPYYDCSVKWLEETSEDYSDLLTLIIE